MSFMTQAQIKPMFQHFPSLPDAQGFAGMYAGVSKGILFCMGGANFPNQKPWEGGKKKWYDDIYMLTAKNDWEKIPQKMPIPQAYGVSVSYKDQFITIGGNNDLQSIKNVTAYSWDGHSLQISHLPDLPRSLSNMAGTLVDHLIVIAGGNTDASSPALNHCLALDLEDLKKGWMELEPIPGTERLLPACASFNHQFYVFSGETVIENEQHEKKRYILNDGYRMTPKKIQGKWTGHWEVLSAMPRGASAAGSPLPVLHNGYMVFWGGVDAQTALHKDPATHPGISGQMYLYSPMQDQWFPVGVEEEIQARVTLPVVKWNGHWLYISGEIRPAVRTNTIVGIQY